MAGGEVHKRRMSQSSGSTIIDPDVEQQDVSPPCSPRGRPSASDPRTSLRHLLANRSSSPPSQPPQPPSSKKRRNDDDRVTAAARSDAGGRGSSHSSSSFSSSTSSRRRQRTMSSTAARARRDSPSAEGEGAGSGNGSSRGNGGGNAPPPSATWTPVATKANNNNTNSTTTTTTVRRAVHNMTTSSVFAGNKMKHIKKEDGMPLWRRDIQYDFLRAVFEDRNAVFTNFHENRRGCTFSDIYVDSMARSSKTSKILRDKLLSDRAAANNMAMVCLLVNVGRMNTTLNFFPEMRAQLRTYHAIPCLQAHQDSSAYKQLQDAPRLKSILKGACEDQNEPNSFEKLRELDVPRTNPVNLIFLLSQYAPKLSDVHFSPQLDFFDLFTRCTLSSRSRARAFLWLMWWYLESDFSSAAALANPFGAGQLPETDGVPQKVPAFEHLTEAQAALENNDTSEELEFGMRKQEERQHILEMESAIAAPSSRRAKRGSLRGPTRTRTRKRSTMDANHSDSDRTRSVSPSGTHGTVADPVNPRASLSLHSGLILLDDQHAESSPLSRRMPRTRPERDRGDRRTSQRPLLSNAEQLRDQSSPAPSLPGTATAAGAAYADDNNAGGGVGGVGGGALLPLSLSLSRRARPTAHQLALTHNRKERVTRLLRQRRLLEYRRLRRTRQRAGPFWRAWRRHEAMDDPFENSEDDDAGSAAAAAMMAGAGAGGSGRGYAAVAVAAAAAAAAAVAAAGGGSSGGHHHHHYYHYHHSHHSGSSGNNRDTNGPFRERGLGGLIPLESEDDDYGEEVAAYAAALRRTARRLNRWDTLDEAVASGRYVVKQEDGSAAAAAGVDGVGGVSTAGTSGGSAGARAMTNGSLKHHRAHCHVNGEDEDEDDDNINNNIHSNGSYARAAPEAEADDEGELDDMDRMLLGEAPPAASAPVRSSGSGGGGGGSRGSAPPPPPPGPSWGIFDGPRTTTELRSLPLAPPPPPLPRI